MRNKLGYRGPLHVLSEVFASLDTDKSGNIGFDELVSEPCYVLSHTAVQLTRGVAGFGSDVLRLTKMIERISRDRSLNLFVGVDIALTHGRNAFGL